MLRLFLLFCLLGNTVYADDIFGKSRMRFATPTVVPVTTPVIQEEKAVVDNTEKVVSEEKRETPSVERTKTPVFEGETKVRNFMKPDFIKRDVLSDPRYKKKSYVRRYYQSMKALHEELDRKEEIALKDAEYKGKAYVDELKHRLWVERPFVLTYLPDDKTLNEALNKDPRNVMYQILTHSEFYPNSDKMTAENRKNIMNEIQNTFQEQSGFTISEFEQIEQEERKNTPSAVEGENLFKNSVYFD